VPVVVTIYDDDDHLFPALQAGAFGYLLKEQPQGNVLIAQLLRMTQGEPPLSPPIARRVLASLWWRTQSAASEDADAPDRARSVKLTERETDVLQRVAKGYTLPGDCRSSSVCRGTPSQTTSNRFTASSTCRRAPKPRWKRRGAGWCSPEPQPHHQDTQ
jgi:hypothetical protein